jgi:hypothetical protein
MTLGISESQIVGWSFKIESLGQASRRGWAKAWGQRVYPRVEYHLDSIVPLGSVSRETSALNMWIRGAVRGAAVRPDQIGFDKAGRAYATDRDICVSSVLRRQGIRFT